MDNGNNCAFPVFDRNGTVNAFEGGLSKREWLAGLAMQGFCANHELTDRDCDTIARFAVAQADALLAELAKVAE